MSVLPNLDEHHLNSNIGSDSKCWSKIEDYAKIVLTPFFSMWRTSEQESKPLIISG